MTSLPNGNADEVELALRDRLPEYLTVFGVGAAAAAGVGVVIALIWKISFAAGIGYTIVALGIILLLAGGATGGGYTSLGIGAATALFGGRRVDEADEDLGDGWSGNLKKSPQDRLREGLRPEANPRAFWQVVGGFSYIALGIAIVALLG